MALDVMTSIKDISVLRLKNSIRTMPEEERKRLLGEIKILLEGRPRPTVKADLMKKRGILTIGW